MSDIRDTKLEEQNTTDQTEAEYQELENNIDSQKNTIGDLRLRNDIASLKDTIKCLNNEIEQLTLLHDTTKKVLFIHDIDKIIKNFLDLVYEITNYKACILYFYKKKKNSYYIKEVRGIKKKEAESRFVLDKNLTDWIMKEERWTVLPFFEQGLSNKEGNGMMSILPMVHQGDNIGFLSIITDKDTNVYSQENIRRVNFVSSQVTTALINEKLYKRLTETKSYLYNILESINHGIFTINREGTLNQINRNATALFGLSDPDIIGKNYKDIFSIDMVRNIDRIREQIMKDGFVMNYQLDYILNEEIMMPVGINASFLTGQDGTLGDIIFVCSHMAATKELERLREIDELKDEFVSCVSHDFRSPLAAMKANVDALLNHVCLDDKDMVREFLEIIDNEIDRLTDLLSDLLDLSRIESGKSKLELDTVDPVSIIKRAIRNFENQDTKCKIEFNILTDIPKLLCDEDKMMQVLLNLIDNAIKYSPDGGKVEVNVKSDHKWTIIDIEDHGIGIDPRDIPYLFDKFYRANFSDTRGIGGTGLGLSIVKQIVEKHRGTIEVESVPNKGTKFTLKFPSKKEKKKEVMTNE